MLKTFQFSITVGCPAEWKMYGESCYLFIDQLKTWPEANRFCGLFGGHLASINDKEEDKFIQSK